MFVAWNYPHYVFIAFLLYFRTGFPNSGNHMYFLGFDLGSSSVKACLVDANSGKAVASAFFPETEMIIESPQAGFAEQQPENWWKNACLASKAVMQKANVQPGDVKAIGISYQMHGLVVVDKEL